MSPHPIPGPHWLLALVVAVIWAVAAASALFLGPDPPAATMTRTEWAMLAVLTAGAVLCAVVTAWMGWPDLAAPGAG